jgi:protein TonB
MDFALDPPQYGRRLPGFVAVVALHVVIGYALVTGLARKVVEAIKPPLEARMIDEIKQPPPDQPPPPPPKLAAPPPPFIPPPEINIQVPVTAPPPAITTVTTAPPPPGPPPVARAPQPAPMPLVRKEYKAAYRVAPQFPREALRRGTTGVVVAHVVVAPSGAVTEVRIVSANPPRVFDREVIRALSQWRFNAEPIGFIGEYEIVFNLKD